MQRPWLKLGVSITTPGQFREKQFPLTFSSSSAAGFGSLLYFLTYPFRAVIMIVVQTEERNMYDQHFVSAVLREKYPFLSSYN